MNFIYCVDTSGWTALKRSYPPANFPSLWDRIDALIKNRRLISPKEVYAELEKQDDAVLKWVKQRRQLFRNFDQEQVALVLEIERKFPKLINSLKETPVADPFVVALAILETRNVKMLGDECAVVSAEKPGSINKPKIPDVCNSYGIKHFTNVELICNEGWIF